jgi:hypothetical protein
MKTTNLIENFYDTKHKCPEARRDDISSEENLKE